MNESTSTLTLNGQEIILIGTAHVSRDSINEVRNAILEGKPDYVCVELDAARYASIVKKENWESLDMAKVFREGKGFLLMANLVLSGFQRRMGAELGVKPGEEMMVALQTADELGIPHNLSDREVHTTLRRAWNRCSLWSKSKLLASLLAGAFTTEKLTAEEIENLKNHNELDGMMSELAEYLPSVKETLIDERDRYLAAKIWNTAQAAGSDLKTSPENASRPPRVIAVVGAGHMNGIKAHLEKLARSEEDSDVSALEKVPPPGFLSQASRFIIPGIIVALIAIGFLRAGADVSLSMILRYILWNGSLAALGALIALGHPLSILVSFLGAPITSLNPFVGIGIFSGITQASLKKPRVGDAQSLTEDISSLKGIYRNRITHALLVFFLSSIGSIAGTFITIPSMATVLFK